MCFHGQLNIVFYGYRYFVFIHRFWYRKDSEQEVVFKVHFNTIKSFKLIIKELSVNY